MRKKSIMLGARIPEELKKQLDEFCEREGVKMGHFVTKAIFEKLSKSRSLEKISQSVQAITLASESSLKKDWLNPKEDEAWKNL